MSGSGLIKPVYAVACRAVRVADSADSHGVYPGAEGYLDRPQSPKLIFASSQPVFEYNSTRGVSLWLFS